MTFQRFLELLFVLAPLTVLAIYAITYMGTLP